MIYKKVNFYERERAECEVEVILVSLNIKYSVIPRVKSSVAGAVSQIPSKPHKAAKTKIEIRRITSPRALEITADSFAMPQEVKYIEPIKLKP